MADFDEHRVALFLNGESPEFSDYWLRYDLCVAADGSYSYLAPLDIKVDFVVGDLDTLRAKGDLEQISAETKVIHIQEQESTDMEKALNFIYQQGYKQVHIYGASGLAQDHFLGNLHVAYKFGSKLKMVFFDKFARYFFLPLHCEIRNVKNRIISLFPLPVAYEIYSEGLAYALQGEDLGFGTRIGIRNKAIDDKITIRFSRGTLLIFIERKPSEDIFDDNFLNIL